MKQKVGLVIFWISVIWLILWGVVKPIVTAPTFHSLTMDELNQTIWALTGPLNIVYGFSVPLGAIVAVVGILLYSGAKGSTVWKVGIGLFIAFIIAFMATVLGLYFGWLFGIGGTLILLSFIGILWLWAKERMALKGSSTLAADFKLVGYVFFFMAAFFI